MLGFLGHVSFLNTGKLLFFSLSRNGEINYTSNIYPPYLSCSNKGLGCAAISSEMPNIELVRFKEVVVI